MIKKAGKTGIFRKGLESMRKKITVTILVLTMLTSFTAVIIARSDTGSVVAKKKSSKVKKIRLVTSKNDEAKAVYLSEKIKKVRVTYSKKNIIVKGKIDKRGNFKYQVKKPGKVTITVKGYAANRKLYGIYKLIMTVKDTRKEERKAFKIQNQYRAEKGAGSLAWSEELYRLAAYRMETSGYDNHKNMWKDFEAYFGKRYHDFFSFNENTGKGKLSENLCSSSNAKDSMPVWKNSSQGHYENLLNKEWKTGAIYSSAKGTIAIFCTLPKSEIENWRSSEKEIDRVVITRKDRDTGAVLTGGQYSVINVSDGDIVCSVGISEGKTETTTSRLVPGQTYKIYEVITPTGYKKAAPLVFTVTHGVNYITLTD